VLDLLLPPHCALCDAQVGAPGQFCAACFQSLRFIGEPACRRCGVPFASRDVAGPDHICPSCRDAPPAWNRARAALLYDDRAKALILPLKNADREENALALAMQMRRAGAALLAQADVLVPVPLHRWRLLRRRYNQSVLLARALSRGSAVTLVADALLRRRATARLGAHSAAERAAMLDGAIAVRPKRRIRIAGQRVLLIDDVLTSGATANACAVALLDAGAANVDVLVASRVADPRQKTGLLDRSGNRNGTGRDDADD
jgi:ComF family protein